MKAQELILNMIIASRIVCRTTTGEVFSIKNGKKRKLKPETSSSGYPRVCLYWNGYKKTVPVHQIIYLYSFLRSYNGREYCIDHKDGDRTNNSISNLRLVDYKENAKNRKKRKRLMKSEVQRIIDMKKDGFTFKQIANAFEININSARKIFNKVERKK